jgi:hypothetical protein
VPEGFENLVAARRLEVAVIFNKVQIGAVDATVDLESITFADAAAVAALVPQLADRSRIANALSGPLPLHAGLVCGELARAGCGQLTPEIAAVIYDSSSEAVQLFVNPSLRIWSADLERLQPHGSEPALLGKLTLNISDQGDLSEPVYSLGLNTVAGSGPTHIRMQTLLRNERTDLQQLHVRRVANGHEQVAGLFNAGHGSFLPPERLLGVRLGATLDDLPADAGAYDIPIIIGLTSPATIDALLGETLIAAARYPAGEARIDTSTFPSGAYTVRLRIMEAGRERIEERFFARGTAFPPLGAPQTSLALGTRYPSVGFARPGLDERTASLQVNHRRRLSHRFGLGGSLHARENGFAAEADLGFIHDTMQWSNSILGASSGELAYASTLRLQTGRWRLFGDVRHFLAADAQGPLDKQRFLGVSESFWQTTLSAGRRFGRAHLQAVAHWRRAAGGSESWSIQPSLDLPFKVLGWQLGLRITADVGPERNGVRLELATPGLGHNVNARAGAQVLQKQRLTPLYEAGISEHWRPTPETELQTELKWLQDGRQSLAGSAQMRTGRGSMFVSLQSDLDTGQRSYFGNAQSAFAWTRAGLALTTPAPGEAAVVYVNNSQSHASPADALLSNVRIGTLEPRQTRIQPVPAFRKVAVGMLPARGASLSGDSRNRETTLFPGTVAVVATQFVHIAAAFGQLLELDGTPIGGALLTGAHGYGASDADGYFQLDVAAEEQVSVRRPDGTACRFKLAVPSADAAIIDAGPIKCLTQLSP